VRLASPRAVPCVRTCHDASRPLPRRTVRGAGCVASDAHDVVVAVVPTCAWPRLGRVCSVWAGVEEACLASWRRRRGGSGSSACFTWRPRVLRSGFTGHGVGDPPPVPRRWCARLWRVGKLGSSVRSGCCRRICSHRTAVSSRACLATFRSFCLWVHAMVTHAMFSSLIRSVRSTMGWIPGAAIWSTSAAAQHGKSKSRRIPIHPSN
jgi:hypothetical protein